LWWQIKSDLKWKKINITLDKINFSLVETNVKIIRDAGINMEGETISDDDFKKITDNQNSILLRAREIIDMLEDFSTLYNMNVRNKYYAFESYSETTIFYYSKFKKIIDFYRINNDPYDPFLYKNLEKCASRFIVLKNNELKKYDKKFKKFEKLKQATTNKLEKMQVRIKHKPSVS
jgi:uncharacterized protein (UPF0147 family)